MTTQRIAVAMIVGGNYSPEKLQACVDSLSPYVQGIFINFNGEDETPLIDLHDAPCSLTIMRRQWEDDFAKARQQSFDMVPKGTYDWILWIDADDTFVGGEHLQDVLSAAPPETAGFFLRYQYQTDEKTGEARINQWRERLLRTNRPWLWQYAVHEVCHTTPGAIYDRTDRCYIKHHREVGAVDSQTRKRNRRILVRARKAHPEEPRYTFYLANEMFAELFARTEVAEGGMDIPDGMRTLSDTEIAQQAIKLYNEFIARTPFEDDAYLANANVAECFRFIRDFRSAIETDMQGLKLKPRWPKSYVGIAKSCMELRDWDRCLFWAEAAIALTEDPKTTQVVEPLEVQFYPRLQRAIALEELERHAEAMVAYEEALELEPTNEVILSRVAALEARMSQDPFHGEDPEWRQQRKLNFGKMPEKSIAFVTRPHWEPWHPYLEMQQGAGGSETCIMRIAPYFLANGWRVVVFGTPGPFAGTDPMGVEWYPSEDFQPHERFKVLVASRAPETFDSDVNADVKLLWMHDVNVGPGVFPNPGQDVWGRMTKIDRVIALSDWHRDHLSFLYGLPQEKLSIIPNGLDERLYAGTDWSRKTGNKFIYSSSPDRGLDQALQMWIPIRKMRPDAELHIFYGWAGIDRLIAASPPEQAANFRMFKERLSSIAEELSEHGVIWHDRVPQHQLAQYQVEMDYWLYPTNFMETNCITAIEMQAAGVIPITTKLAALAENIAVPDLAIAGYNRNDSYVSEYLGLVERVLTASDDERQKWRNAGFSFAMTRRWDDSFALWAKLLSDLGVE